MRSGARIAAGNAGGVYLAYAQALADAVPVRDGGAAAVLETAGAVENLRLVGIRGADIAFTTADAAATAMAGDAPFDEPVELAALGRLYDNYIQVIVRRGSGITTGRELEGRTVAGGSPSSGTALVTERLLDAAGAGTGTRVLALDIADAVAGLAEGTVDAVVWTGGLPTAAVADLAARVPLELVDLSTEAEVLMARYGDVYRPSTIPASVYGSSRPTRTFSTANYLVVSADLPTEDVAAWMATLFTDPRVRRAHPEAERLRARTAIATGTVPLHPAAAQWYRDTS